MSDLSLVRYHADGVLDATFGGGGIVMTDLSTTDDAYAVVLLLDGRFVVAGYGGIETHSFGPD